MNPPTPKAKLLYVCPECGHIRTLIGVCSQVEKHEKREGVSMVPAWYAPIEDFQPATTNREETR